MGRDTCEDPERKEIINRESSKSGQASEKVIDMVSGSPKLDRHFRAIFQHKIERALNLFL